MPAGSLKVAVGGTHSTGKTSFLKNVLDRLTSENIECKLVTDLASRCPLPILRKHTVESTLWIVTTGIAEEIEASHKAQLTLVDRPVVDAWAYLAAVQDESQILRDPKGLALEALVRHWLPTYSYIYLTVLDPKLPVQDDKNRDVDEAYRKEISSQMDKAYGRFNLRPRRLLSDNVDRQVEELVLSIRQDLLKA